LSKGLAILLADHAATARANCQVSPMSASNMAVSARKGASEFVSRCSEKGKRHPGGLTVVGFPLYASLDIRLPVGHTCCRAPVTWALDAVPLLSLNYLGGTYWSTVQDVAKDGHAERPYMCTRVGKASDGR
jgi:hypothetical protein